MSSHESTDRLLTPPMTARSDTVVARADHQDSPSLEGFGELPLVSETASQRAPGLIRESPCLTTNHRYIGQVTGTHTAPEAA
jgi:hypothetical protein